MTAKQYLKQAYRLNELINSDIAELDELKKLSTSVSSPSMSGMPGSGTKSNDAPFVKCINKIIDLEQEINAEIDRFVDLKKEIRDVINAISNQNERLLLRLRYIEFLTWEQIAEKMSYSVMQVHRIHADSLKNVKIPKT